MDVVWGFRISSKFQNPQLQRNVPITKKRDELKNIKMSLLEFGIGGWPPISSWISPPPLGSNGINCVEFLGKRGKHLMNLNLRDLRALLENLQCLVCGRIS
jgi:hypothetical protein